MIPLPAEPLVGDEVLLRLWTPADADWYVQARDDEVFRWTTEPRDLSSGALSDAIARMRRRAAFAGFAIADRASGELFGNIALTVPDPVGRVGEIMYWLAPSARGRGAATDAVRTVSRWAFDRVGLRRLEILTDPGNVRSQAVARRSEFVAEAPRDGRLVFARCK